MLGRIWNPCKRATRLNMRRFGQTCRSLARFTYVGKGMRLPSSGLAVLSLKFSTPKLGLTAACEGSGT